MGYYQQARFNQAQDDYLRAPDDDGDLCYFCHNEADGSLEFDYCLACSDCYHAQSLKALEDSNQATTRLTFERDGEGVYVMMWYKHDEARAKAFSRQLGAYDTYTAPDDWFYAYTDLWRFDALALWIDDLLNN